MIPRLFHISEEEGIEEFIPRVSKKQWGYQKYVWALDEEHVHNYLLPRDCPRICVGGKDLELHGKHIHQMKNDWSRAVLFAPLEWEAKIKSCTLFKYEFSSIHFELIDSIGGYYVSIEKEKALGKIKIDNCLQELALQDVELILMPKQELLRLKEQVIQELTDFSIIRWSVL